MNHRILAVAVLAVGLAAPAAAETIRTFPADCSATPQACINASAPGDVVRIGTATPVDATLLVTQSLTLEAAPGVAARLAQGRHVVVSHSGTKAADVTVRGLTLEHGTIGVTQSGTGALRVAILDNVILDSASGPFGAIDVRTFSVSSDTGDVEFEIRGNTVAGRKSLVEPPVGIRIAPGTKGNAAGVIAGNRIAFPDQGEHGYGIVLWNETRSLTADVIGNLVAGDRYGVGVDVRQTATGGELNARVANNVVHGVAGETRVLGIELVAGRGTLRAAVLNNTVADVDSGIAVFSFDDPSMFLDALVANNVIARAATTGDSGAIAVDLQGRTAFRFGPNLIFDFFRSLLPARTLLADPRFAGGDDFRLAPGSPAVNAGDAGFVPADLTTDLLGNPRVAGGAVDLGAFEAPCPDGTFFPGPCPTPDPGPGPTCDPARCDDGDPCTADACGDGGACVHTVLEGLAGARCACERPAPAACAADAVPRRVERQTAQACALLGRADGGPKAARLLRRAARAWTKAARLVARKRARAPQSPACRTALADTFRDAGQRTRSLAANAR
jgi:hypothetical protein